MDPARGVFKMEEIKVSQYVIEMLGLQVGEQSRLMAITRLRHCDDQVMVNAHGFKAFHGYFVQSFKLCYDEADDTVYALAHLDDLSEYYHGFKSRVGVTFVIIYKVNSIVIRPGSSKAFNDILVRIKVCFLFYFSFFSILDAVKFF